MDSHGQILSGESIGISYSAALPQSILPLSAAEGDIVEKQRVSLFAQKNRWGLTALSIAACVLLAPALSMALFLPQALAVTPLLLMAMLAYAGPVSAAVCSLIFVMLGSALFGLYGGVAVALLLAPVVLVSAVLIEREQPFWVAVAGGGVAMFASTFVVVAMLTVLAGSDVVTALTGYMNQALSVTGGVGDMMLGLMSGILDQQGGFGAPATREELVSSVVMIADSALRLEIPMQMVTAAVACGLLGQAILRKGLLRRGIKVEYPPLRTWRVPKGWGRILGGTLAALYLLAQLVPSSMTTMFYVFSGVFNQVFSLQGIASLCYLVHKRGKSARWQALIFAAGYFLVGTVAVMIGISDQAMDFTHRREELDKLENRFDPRRGDEA